MALAVAVAVTVASAAVLLLILLVSRLSLTSEQIFLDFPASRGHQSVEHCGPLVWLLSDTRLLFLRPHGAFAREFRIRHRRSRLFKEYLQGLEGRFAQTSLAVKTVMVNSPCDRPDLATILIRAQFAFALRLAMVRWRLWRYVWGFR